MFLITIADRSVGGLVARDQLVGPHQEPVSDCAVSALDFSSGTGHALALGERVQVALVNPEASIRLALAEAITNLCSAQLPDASKVMLSANWMADRSSNQDVASLSAQVDALAALARSLTMCVAVGKDSLSMKIASADKKSGVSATSPPYGVISATSFIGDITSCVTPELLGDSDTLLCHIGLSAGKRRMGGSAFVHVFGCEQSETPDIDDPTCLASFIALMQDLHKSKKLLAYHDCSDGGAIVALLEMAFTSRLGLTISDTITQLSPHDKITSLFSEEPGVIIQIQKSYLPKLEKDCAQKNLAVSEIATINQDTRFVVGKKEEDSFDLKDLWKEWNAVSKQMQTIRDGDTHADVEELESLRSFDKQSPEHEGLFCKYVSTNDSTAVKKFKKDRQTGESLPRAVVLRDEGCNSHRELSRVLFETGFSVADIHLNDLYDGRYSLQDFELLCFPGGFTYGDVLGAGWGVATSILNNKKLREEFERFFERPTSLALGFCNGCQILSHLREIIPGSDGFIPFDKNFFGRFESRVVMVTIPKSPSVFLSPFTGSQLPIVVSHSEGRMDVLDPETKIALRYRNAQYPGNPNGSTDNIAGICSDDGRVTLMMPHPERMFKSWQNTWRSQHEDPPEVEPWYSAFEELKKTLAS